MCNAPRRADGWAELMMIGSSLRPQLPPPPPLLLLLLLLLNPLPSARAGLEVGIELVIRPCVALAA